MAMENIFDTREEASASAANFIGESLADSLNQQGTASLVVSGGTSPKRCFNCLSDFDICWGKVKIVLSDERWVAADDANSNENLVRRELLVNRACGAELLPFYDKFVEIEKCCEYIDNEIRHNCLPFACSLLGMGTDGHFASLFPDVEDLQQKLNIDESRYCVSVETASSPYPRVSLTLFALSHSRSILLLIFGDEKRAIYEQAKNLETQYPISLLLSQCRAPVHVFWAP